MIVGPTALAQRIIASEKTTYFARQRKICAVCVKRWIKGCRVNHARRSRIHCAMIGSSAPDRLRWTAI